jgi:uncharacterized membrane protein YidH (DUF202 family)
MKKRFGPQMKLNVLCILNCILRPMDFAWRYVNTRKVMRKKRLLPLKPLTLKESNILMLVHGDKYKTKH